MKIHALIGSLALAAAVCAPVAAQTSPAPSPSRSCTSDSTFHLLDFWVGSWDVYVGTTLDGHDRVSRILADCAVTEEWSDADGSKGLSLFFVQPGTGDWRQVWVTERATQPGGLKEKRLVERLAGGGVRFQGTIIGPSGNPYLDRTTLTPLPSGEVHQVIEASRDGGTTWRPLYDAIYRKSAAP
jgi:hypothetical protein